MNTSLCITVLNEEKSVGKLLESIFAGTKKPDEIIIVDGGSTDKTLSVISKFQFSSSNFQLIKKRNISIAQGRNLAIKKAKGNIIVQIDAGCIAKKDWLKKITQPFKDSYVDIVAGYYEMPAKTPLQSVLNVFLGIPPERFNVKTFVPSARSVAFTKTVWKKVGGYDENLNGTSEDTLFFYKAQTNNFKIERVGDACVVWEETRNLGYLSALKKFFNYAKGDAKSGIWWDPSKQFRSHNIKIILTFARYILGFGFGLLVLNNYSTPLLLVFVTLLISYLFYPIYKWHDVVKTTSGRLWLPIVQIGCDLAVMSGFASGIINK